MTDVQARLLDFSQAPEVYVQTLDNTVDAFFQSINPQERAQASQAIEALKAHPKAWEKVDVILQHSKSQQAKFVALQILEETIKTRWNILPEEQRQGIRTFLSNVIISVATNEGSFKRDKVYLNKLNLVLVQVLKKDWPARWPNFVPELVGASKTSETLCENSMHILRLLSEEVFDFNRGELTQAKTQQLKASLNSEFQHVHDLCHFVLSSVDLWPKKPDLIKATLAALQVYLTWIPLGYIFDTNLLEILLNLFPLQPFRNLALQCLSEVGSLPEAGDEYNNQFVELFRVFMGQLVSFLPPSVDIPAAYAAGSEEDQQFVQNLALFLTSFLRQHLALIEGRSQLHEALIAALQYLVKISYVSETEVFKTCLDYWNRFVPDVFSSVCAPGVLQPGLANFGMPAPGLHPRAALYSGVMQQLRLLMIERMARPEEVIVVEDENGNAVRDTMRDTDTIAQYKTMRETLVYLSHLDHANTEEQMLEKLRRQLNGSEWGWNPLCSLCWAIGSISGSMDEEQENRFLVTVIRDLLTLCEQTRGKDNKAVIASNIMYVVGQYPRFLRAHWKFLKTVVNKLFEFMHELHPGVQDMAVETLLKICHKCKRKFVVQQPTEKEPFIVELLRELPVIIQDLQLHQINVFYESIGLMIGTEEVEATRNSYLSQLMGPPNSRWRSILEQARADGGTLRNPDIQKTLHNILQSNVSVCTSLGGRFMPQMAEIYRSMLHFYQQFSELISIGIREAGPLGARSTVVKTMRGVKKVTLKLIETFVETCSSEEELAIVARDFVPELLDPILADYRRGHPDARDAEVLGMFAIIINKLRDSMVEGVPLIFEAVFECTLDMITRNFEDYPDHRLKFFSLLHAITNNCFPCLLRMSAGQQKLVIDSIIWAIRHTERNVAETGLSLLADMLARFVEQRAHTGAFFRAYYTTLLSEILAVMTDTMHKPGFRQQARILSTMLQVVKANLLDSATCPLWDAAAGGAGAFPSNAAFVHAHLVRLLGSSFPNMTPAQVEDTVTKMFANVEDFSAFKNHLRDFLIQTKEFGATNNDELFADERAAADAQRAAAVPGLANPNGAR